MGVIDLLRTAEYQKKKKVYFHNARVLTKFFCKIRAIFLFYA